MAGALDNLVGELRGQGLDARADAVEIVLESDDFDESARFDPALEEEPALPDWLTDYTLHVPIIGVLRWGAPAGGR